MCVCATYILLMEARNRLREEAAVLDSGLMSGREHSHPTEKIRDASTSIKMEGALPIPDQQNIVVSPPAKLP